MRPTASPAHSPARRAARWLAALAVALLASDAHVASALVAPEQAPASAQALRAHVAALLEQPDAPLREADWRRLGPEALPLLEQLASNPREADVRRTRAVASMALVEHPEAPGRLRALLEDSSTPPALRASAALALSLRGGPEALATLRPHLEDRHEQVRGAVALAIGRLGGTQAQQALVERLPLEEALPVREALQQALTVSEP